MSKIEQLYAEWQSLQPLKDEYQQRLNRKFMLEFNYNSNHLEGNTLTYGQTELLLLFGKVTEAANMKDLEDMKASNVGLNMMKEQALSEYPLTETFIRQLHKTLLREDYTVYRYHLATTFDFKQEILSRGPAVTVLSPEYFRQEVLDDIKNMVSNY